MGNEVPTARSDRHQGELCDDAKRKIEMQGATVGYMRWQSLRTAPVLAFTRAKRQKSQAAEGYYTTDSGLSSCRAVPSVVLRYDAAPRMHLGSS
jgi:hypothetical protein